MMTMCMRLGMVKIRLFIFWQYAFLPTDATRRAFESTLPKNVGKKNPRLLLKDCIPLAKLSYQTSAADIEKIVIDLRHYFYGRRKHTLTIVTAENESTFMHI